MHNIAKKALPVFISFCLVISSIPAESQADSFLAPPGGIDIDAIKSNAKDDISRRGLLKAIAAGAVFFKATPLMAGSPNSNNNSPKMISLADEIDQVALELYRFPRVYLNEPHSLYDALAWQKRLANSGKPLEFGPGYIYHGCDHLDDAIIGKKVKGEKLKKDIFDSKAVNDKVLRSYFTRLPHKWAVWNMNDPNSNSPAIYMVHTREFNKLVDEGKASLDYQDNKNDMIDPYPNIFNSFSLDIVSEIWVRDNDYERYEKLVNMTDKETNQLSKRENALREKLTPLFKKGIIKPILILSHKVLTKIDKSERSRHAEESIGQWMGIRRGFDMVPVFIAKDEPLPKTEPLSPLDAISKFMSDLPQGLSSEEVLKRFRNSENHLSMDGYFALMPNALTFFRNENDIISMWLYTLKTPEEIESICKEILSDAELIRLIMLIERGPKDDFQLKQRLFLSEDARHAIKDLIRKDFGVNLLANDVMRSDIFNCLFDESRKNSMISFISALDPEKLLNSSIFLNIIKEVDNPTLKEATLYLDKCLAVDIFWKNFSPVYSILINRGYSSEKAGKLLADWSYYIGNVFREIGKAGPIDDPKLKESNIISERIAEELIRREKILSHSTLKGLFLLAVTGVSILMLIYHIRKFISTDMPNIRYFREALREKSPGIEEALKDKHIEKLIALTEPNRQMIRSILANIDSGRTRLRGSDFRAIIEIIKQMRSKPENSKNTTPAISEIAAECTDASM